MNKLGVLDLTHAVYDQYLRTDGERRVDERRRAEAVNELGPSDQAFGLNAAQARLLGRDPSAQAGTASGEPAHTLNPSLRLRA